MDLLKRQSSVFQLNGKLKAVILIGGPHVGTRFRPLSLELPQPLFPIAGSPWLQHHIEAIVKHPDVREILLIGFYNQSQQMSRFVDDMQRKYGIPIRYLQEYAPLGTAGGIYHFRDQILRGNPRAFFVFNSDVCCDFPVWEMAQFHSNVTGGNGYVILGTEANEQQALSYGCIVEEPSTHKVLHYVEKPETFVSNIINAGGYIFSPDIFQHLTRAFTANYENELIHDAARDSIDLHSSVLTPLAGNGDGGKLYVYKMNSGFWTQVKNAGHAIYANRLYLSLFKERHPEYLATNTPGGHEIYGAVRIHPSAQIDSSAVLGPNVYVGAGVVIGAGARVREAIVLDRAVIQEHSCVLHSIVGWDCVLGAWSRIEGYPSDLNPNDPVAKITSESLFNLDGRLNPSITILGKDSKRVLNWACGFTLPGLRTLFAALDPA
ncbi:Mannose-1-phosphate guanyltransferase alpha-A [Geodia barretti]|uniref:Mannose-1-phosphate guanyltransferase alpha-A n=1 Tax=Geodia barretti TaxID=519541 RepID=A0AA35R3T0_GEOBA|nr:Mannose-1-phosphate guanyltransferase alpha-A [Geodia barretti]